MHDPHHNSLSSSTTENPKPLRSMRFWLAIRGFAGLALCSAFFMPLIPVCGDPATPAQFALSYFDFDREEPILIYFETWQWDVDTQELFEHLTLILRTWAPYLFGLFVAVSSLRSALRIRSFRAIETDRTLRTVYASFALLIVAVFAYAVGKARSEYLSSDLKFEQLFFLIVCFLAIMPGPFLLKDAIVLRKHIAPSLYLHASLVGLTYYSLELTFSNFEVFYGWYFATGGLSTIALSTVQLTRLYTSSSTWRALVNVALARPRDFGSCPVCGYDLRGAVSAYCPECGRKSPTLQLANNKKSPALE